MLACRTLENAKKLAEGVHLATPISLNVSDEKALDAQVAKHELVIRCVCIPSSLILRMLTRPRIPA